MAYEKDPYNFDKLDQVPDFAMQPAKEAQTESYDPSVYEKLFADGAAFVPAKPAEAEIGETAGEAAEEADAPAEPVNGMAPAEAVETVAPVDAPEAEFASEPADVKPVAEPVFAPAVQEAEDAAPVAAEPVEEELTEEIALVDETTERSAELVSAPAEEAEPVNTLPINEEIPAAPITAPAAPGSAPKTVPAKIVPVGSAMLTSNLKMTDIKQKPQIRVFIEEDILVPDVKPDLASILSMDGKLKLADKEIYTGNNGASTLKLSGDFMLQTLYIPDHPGENEPIVSIESRIPFKEESEIKAEPYSDITVIPQLESVDFTVVNERKFKVRATVVINIREYRDLDIALFSGIQGEELQMLKEKIRLTDVSQRKTDTIEIQEELPMKDSAPDIAKILRYDVNVVENHKQVNREKAVINAAVYCNVMYLGEVKKEDGDDVRICQEPMFYQGKTEFTQFIRLEDDDAQAPAGSRVRFNPTSVSIVPKENEEGRFNAFELSMNVDTSIELLKDVEAEIVSDVYHHEKEIRYDTDEVGLMHLCGSGMAEVSTREIINVPEKNGVVDRVVFLSGNITDVKPQIENGRVAVEGAVTMKVICMGTEEKAAPFSLRQELPFRCVIDVPGAGPDMNADCEVVLKELWFDKINSRQVEVNAGILVNCSVTDQEKHRLIKNVNFVELPDSETERPGIVLYITRQGDNLWKIAKKYRTTIDEIRKVNEFETDSAIKPGTKLLIVK